MGRVALHVTVRLVKYILMFRQTIQSVLPPPCPSSSYAKRCLVVFNSSNSLASVRTKELAQFIVHDVSLRVYMQMFMFIVYA